MRTWSLSHLTLFLCLFSCLLTPFSVFADSELGTKLRPTQCLNQSLNQKNQAQDQVTVNSSAAEIPTPLKKPKIIIPLGCDRPFTIHGETYSTDSPQAQDASNLKYFMTDVPEASSLLDEYQHNRLKSRISAYTGTIGVFMMIFSNTIANRFSPDSRDSIRSTIKNAGLAITLGGFVYSFALLRFNESLIPKSVNLYNQAKPSNPIELQFQAGWSF